MTPTITTTPPTAPETQVSGRRSDFHDDSPVGLGPGRWAPVHGVLRWIPDLAAQATAPEEIAPARVCSCGTETRHSQSPYCEQCWASAQRARWRRKQQRRRARRQVKQR